MNGKIIKVANGHLSFEIYEALPEFVPKLCEIIQGKFGCLQEGRIAIGLSEVATEIDLSGIKLELGWDNWSGAYVMAYCNEGDKLIEKIGEFLSSEIEKSEYKEFIDKKLKG